jgi:uncharacterized membrane protein
MIGFELKGLIIILLIISIIINFMTYEEKHTNNGTLPKNNFWFLLLLSIFLFIFALYLNEQTPIYLF